MKKNFSHDNKVTQITSFITTKKIVHVDSCKYYQLFVVNYEEPLKLIHSNFLYQYLMEKRKKKFILEETKVSLFH